MYRSHIARSAVRRGAVTRSQCHARKMATSPPPPPPLGTETKDTNMPLVVGGIAAAGALGAYYYMSQRGKEDDALRKARELDHAARVQAQKKLDEGKEKYDEAKADSKAKFDSAQSSAQQGYNSAASRASAAAADAQVRFASYKDSAASSLQHAKDSTEKGMHDAKAYVEEKEQEVKSSWWSWFGWGKGKAEDTKKGARDQAAGEAEKSAEKRA